MLLALQGLPAAAVAANYYVATNGSADNSSPGTREQPWGDLQKAIWYLHAGDTLTILNEYTLQKTLWITVNGTAAAPITINSESYPSDNPRRVICAMAATSSCISVNHTSYLTLAGLLIDNPTFQSGSPFKSGLLNLHASDNIVVARNEFRSAPGFGVWLTGCTVANACENRYDHDYRIEGNTFSSGQNTALYVVNTRDAVVQGNQVDQVLSGDGMVFEGESVGVTIEDNTVTNVNGVTTEGNGRDGIKVRPPSQNAVIRRNRVETVSGAGIYLIDAGVSDGPRHRSAQIVGNVVTNVARVNAGNNDPKCELGGWPSALNVAHTDDVLINDNQVYKNYGEGITLNSVTLGTALRNNAHDNFGVNFYLNNASDITLDRNRAINNPSLQAYYRCGAPAGGISMANEVGRIRNFILLRNISITNNILANSRFGINYYWNDKINPDTQQPYYHEPSWIESTRILNNTVHATWVSGVSVTAKPGHNNNRIESNIWVHNAKINPVADVPSTGFACTANLWYAGTSSQSCYSVQDVFADPLLVNASNGKTADDFKLSKGSPAINAAGYTSVMPSIWHDYFGTKRALSAWDIGAHEFKP